MLILGIWVAVLPYLGFPHSWKNLLFSLSGVALVYLGYTFYKELGRGVNAAEDFESFSENPGFEEKMSAGEAPK
jgi:hypothetical protein